MKSFILFTCCLIKLGRSFMLLYPNTIFKANVPWPNMNFLCGNTYSRSRKCNIDHYGLNAAKTSTTKKKSRKEGSSSPAISLKGFGGNAIVGGSRGNTSSSSSSDPTYELDRSKEALAFYDFIEKRCVGIPNLKKVALAYFPMTTTENGEPSKLRGVVALRPIKKGEAIIQIPYSMAINLGSDGTDVTSAAVNLLRSMFQESSSIMTPVFQMLPGMYSADCMGSTDFFSIAALDELQFPPIKEETLARREKVRRRFQIDLQQQPKLGRDDEVKLDLDKAVATEDHLRWAVWLVASRILTVQGTSDGLSAPTSYKLLIPLIDMCNHDRNSPHILTGRAAPGGMLKVIAGCNIDVGEEIRFCYGGGVEGNDRFIQDYGFLDESNEAYNIIAQKLLDRKKFSAAEIKSIFERLSETSMEADEAMLKKQLMGDIRTAIQFRLGLKKALASVKAQSEEVSKQ